MASGYAQQSPSWCSRSWSSWLPRRVSFMLLGLRPGKLLSSSPVQAVQAGSCLLLSEELLSISKEFKLALFPSLNSSSFPILVSSSHLYVAIQSQPGLAAAQLCGTIPWYFGPWYFEYLLLCPCGAHVGPEARCHAEGSHTGGEELSGGWHPVLLSFVSLDTWSRWRKTGRVISWFK